MLLRLLDLSLNPHRPLTNAEARKHDLQAPDIPSLRGCRNYYGRAHVERFVDTGGRGWFWSLIPSLRPRFYSSCLAAAISCSDVVCGSCDPDME